MWGLDLIGPLQRAPGGYTHLLVAVDKFSKWIEAQPITKIKSEQAVQFFTDSLQVRSPELDHHGQRHPIHGKKVLEVLR